MQGPERNARGRIGARRGQASLRLFQDSRLRSFKRVEEIDRRFDAAQRLLMRNQGVKLGFGFGTEGNHALGVSGAGFSSACIRAMLARSRSSTGLSGTVCPAAICASLRARRAAIDSGTGLSGQVYFINLAYHKIVEPEQPKKRRKNAAVGESIAFLRRRFSSQRARRQDFATEFCKLADEALSGEGNAPADAGPSSRISLLV